MKVLGMRNESELPPPQAEGAHRRPDMFAVYAQVWGLTPGTMLVLQCPDIHEAARLSVLVRTNRTLRMVSYLRGAQVWIRKADARDEYLKAGGRLKKVSG